MLKKLKSGLAKIAGASKEKSAGKELRRLARIQIDSLQGVHLQMHVPKELNVGIANITTSGVGLISTSELGDLKKGTQIKGKISLPKGTIPMIAEVMHISPTLIGCAFQGDLSLLQKEIEQHFDLELAAVNLIEVNREILKEEEDGEPRLFRGRNNCEIYVVEKAGAVVRFQMSFFGNFIEGGRGLKTKVGYLATVESDEAKVKHKGSAFVRMTSNLPKEVLSAASRFLEHVPNLSKEHRGFIQTALTNAIQ